MVTRTGQDDGSVDLNDFQSKTQDEFEDMTGTSTGKKNAGSKDMSVGTT